MATPKTGDRELTQFIVPAAAIAVVGLMVVPLPPILLDLLLSIDIGLAVVLMLTAIYVKEPVDFSVFPSLLLLLTLLRLSLNVASTRLVLLHGGEGVQAAGSVIQAFGQFVIGGNYVVGIVVFIVLIAIQFIVINHGAVRISEVTARFTLDAGIIKDTYILDYEWDIRADGTGAVSWELVEASVLKRMDGTYTLIATDEGWTDVSYQLTVDLKIPVLGMLKRKAERVIIDTALTELKKRVESL